MSKIEVDAIEPQSGTTLTIGASGDTITIPSGATLTNNGTATGFGKVLQVVSATKTDVFSITSQTFTDVTGLSVSITPSSASNKILIIASLYGGSIGNNSFGRLMRDSTPICIADANTDNRRASFGNFYHDDLYDPIYVSTSQNFLDSPNTTSATTYKIQVMCHGTSTLYINYGGATETDTSRGRNASSITIMEIAG
jgi:hypothetical protein